MRHCARAVVTSAVLNRTSTRQGLIAVLGWLMSAAFVGPSGFGLGPQAALAADPVKKPAVPAAVAPATPAKNAVTDKPAAAPKPEAPAPAAKAPAPKLPPEPAVAKPTEKAVDSSKPHPTTVAITAATDALVSAFNSKQVDQLVALFHPDGELVDENGDVHHGAAALREIFAGYFDIFPEAHLTATVDEVRLVGEQLATSFGERRLRVGSDGAEVKQRYEAVWLPAGAEWKIASLQEIAEEDEAVAVSPLAGLEWLVGHWRNEGDDGVVHLHYRWDDNHQFLLGDLTVKAGDEIVMQSQQRIGWDPALGLVRSWLFESDGGFGESFWTEDEGRWILKSMAVLPDGDVGSATVELIPEGADRFRMVGRDRIVAGGHEPDFDVTVIRVPPEPGTAALQP